MNTFKNAQRVQESFLSGLEKKTLVWLAHRTPGFINSDHLTALGLISMFGAGLSYWVSGSHPALGLSLATLCLALNWLGDSLDGTLARVRNKLRPRYGFYVDHVVDMLGALFLLGGLALSGFMSAPVAGGVVIAFLMLSINSYLATYTMGEFRFRSVGLVLPSYASCWRSATFFYSGNLRDPVRSEGSSLRCGRAAGIIRMAVLHRIDRWNTAQLYREEPIA